MQELSLEEIEFFEKELERKESNLKERFSTLKSFLNFLEDLRNSPPFFQVNLSGGGKLLFAEIVEF